MQCKSENVTTFYVITRDPCLTSSISYQHYEKTIAAKRIQFSASGRESQRNFLRDFEIATHCVPSLWRKDTIDEFKKMKKDQGRVLQVCVREYPYKI